MKLLVFNWGAYTAPDIQDSFEHSGISYDTVSYHFRNKNNDEFFEKRFSEYLMSGEYAAVFSVNFFPLVAKCCNKFNIKYVSWSYDNPLNVPDIETTLGYETNYVFLFDRVQAQGFIDRGFKTVYHMPLAVNTRRLDRIKPATLDMKQYQSEIAFVGKLYDSDLGMYMSAMSDYQKGMIDSIIKAQGQLYGIYLLDELITDEFVTSINETYKSKNEETRFRISKEALTYAMAAQVTREERLTLLSLLSSRHEVKLYSREKNELLKNVKYMGSCGYLDEMPQIFKLSKINLNMTLKILQSGIPLRALDVLGAGGFLLSNYQPEIDEFFTNGEEVVMYDSIEDAFEKATYYLSNEEKRKQIALNGYLKVKTEFSYEKQLASIFSIAKVDI